MFNRHRRQLFGLKTKSLTAMGKAFVPSYKKIAALKTIDPFLTHLFSSRISDEDPDFPDLFLGPFNCVHNGFPVNCAVFEKTVNQPDAEGVTGAYSVYGFG